MPCADYEPDESNPRRHVHGRGRTGLSAVVTDILFSHPCPRCGEPNPLMAEITVGSACRICGERIEPA